MGKAFEVVFQDETDSAFGVPLKNGEPCGRVYRIRLENETDPDSAVVDTREE